MTLLKTVLYRLVGVEKSSGILRRTVLKDVLVWLVGGADFRFTPVDGIEDCLYTLVGEHSSGIIRSNVLNPALYIFRREQSLIILRWYVLKNALYRLVGGEIFSSTAVDSTEHCFIQVQCGALFRYIAVDYIEGCLYRLVG